MENALKYAAEGRFVDVRARCREKMLTVEVQDYGPGIDPERRMKIFQPGYESAGDSGEVGGMGIGLELCKILVERHGGKIILVTESGKGCLFTVELPLLPPGPLPRASR